MSFRRLFIMLFAFAILFAPLAMPEGGAAAAAPHHGQMADAGHCSGKSESGKSHKAVDYGCCTAMCIGIAVGPASADGQLAYDGIVLRPSVDRYRRGHIEEIATPPPRTV
jgi:hypothetical protein